MPDTTPIYGFPFLELGDPPDLASGTEDLAEAVETQIARMDTQPTLQIFTANGTWTKPAGLKAVRVRVIGGGGAGGWSSVTVAAQASAGGGGGGGEYAEAMIPAASLGATVAVTCGAAGAASGGNGGASSFGAHVIANGGQGGTNASAVNTGVAAGGQGGTGGGGTAGTIFRRDGEDGDVGRMNAGEPIPARGGASALSYGAGGQMSAGINVGVGVAGQTYGGGGSGGLSRASQAGQSGGNGATGGVLVENLY